MKLFRLADPGSAQYAHASRIGAWESSPQAGVCSTCKATSQRRIQPLIIQWEAGSSAIADVTWVGYGHEVAVTAQGFAALREFGGYERGPVEMQENPDLEGSAAPHVSLPYTGPELWESWITARVALDRERSAVRLRTKCPACGTEQWDVEGIESIEKKWNKDLKRLDVTRLPMQDGAGLTVAASSLGDAQIFRVAEFPGWMLCTESVRYAALERGLANVDFLEIGRVV
jgi:hypothetical protein